MSQLKETVKAVDQYLVSNRSTLIFAKLSFLLLVLLGCVMAYVHTFEYWKKSKLSFFEWNLIQLSIAIVLCLPLFVMPLYKFISDRKMNRFVWDIKRTIFESTLSTYNCTFKISINGCLPDADISKLELDKGLVSFVYGDDLIIGAINNVRFRLSEVHSSGFIKRYFDGVIAVLIFDYVVDVSRVDAEKILVNSNFEIRVFENKLYLLAKGKKRHFNLRIKRRASNMEELNSDYFYFNDIVSTMNQLTLKL